MAKEDDEIISQVEVCFDGTLICPRDESKLSWEDCVGCEYYHGRENDIDCFLINCGFDDDFWMGDDYECDEETESIDAEETDAEGIE